MGGNSAGAPGSMACMGAAMPSMVMPAMGMMNMMGMMGAMNPCMMGMMAGMNPMMGMMAAMRPPAMMGMGMPDMQQGSTGTADGGTGVAGGGDTNLGATGGCFMPGMNPMMGMMAMRPPCTMGAGMQALCAANSSGMGCSTGAGGDTGLGPVRDQAVSERYAPY